MPLLPVPSRTSSDPALEGGDGLREVSLPGLVAFCGVGGMILVEGGTWLDDVVDEPGSSLSSGGGSANTGRGGRSSSSGGGSLNEGLVGNSGGGSLKAGLAGAVSLWPEIGGGGGGLLNWFKIDGGGGGGTGRFEAGALAAVTGWAAGNGNDGISGDLTPLLANDGFWAIC